jgi:hypothetical protein
VPSRGFRIDEDFRLERAGAGIGRVRARGFAALKSLLASTSVSPEKDVPEVGVATLLRMLLPMTARRSHGSGCTWSISKPLR